MQKCIDSSAVCELKINHVWITQDKPQAANNNLARSLVGDNGLRTGSPNRISSKLKTQGNDKNETRSEFHGNFIRRGGPVTTLNKQPPRHNLDIEPKRFSKDSYMKSKMGFNDEDLFIDDARETRTIGGGAASIRRR